jgi:uncharacterized protein
MNNSSLIMSPRIKRLRKVISPPLIRGFKPFGPDAPKDNREPVIMLYEEYEALRLCDYDFYNHHQASELMGVSRPTFTRIYASARQKIAKAFVEGKTITIEGGKVYFDSDWYHCQSCECYFNNPEKDTKVVACPLCSAETIVNFEFEDAEREEECIKPRGKRTCGKHRRKRGSAI